jgi:hypothetical protein
MATPQKIIIPQHCDRSEMPMSVRLAQAETNEGPSFQHFTVSIGELFIVLKNWMLSKFFVLESNRSVEVKGFNRPRSGGSFQVEGRMKDSIGKAKYQKDPRTIKSRR